MVNWFNKLIGSSSGGPTGADYAWAEHFGKLLEPLDKITGRSNMSREALSYVLDGEPVSVLQVVVQQKPLVTPGLIAAQVRSDDGNIRPAFYEKFGDIPPPIALRWARLLAASAGASSRYFRLQFSSGVNWPEALMLHAAGVSLNSWGARLRAGKLSAATMERLLIEDGLDPSAVLVSAFATSVTSGGHWNRWTGQRLQVVMTLSGYAEALSRHLEKVRPFLVPGVVAQRIHALLLLSPLPQETLARIAGELVELASSGSKQVRSTAEPLLRICDEAAVPDLKKMANQGNPEQRLHALRFIWTLAEARADTALNDFARETALADKAPSVQALIGEWEASGGVAVASQELKYEYAVPDIEWRVELTPAVGRILDELWRRLNQSIEQANKQMRQWHDQMKARGRTPQALRQDSPLSSSELGTLRAYLESSEAKCTIPIRAERALWRYWQVLQSYAGAEGMTPVILLKVLAAFGLAFDNNGALTMPAAAAFGAMHKAGGRPTLLELAVMMEGMGSSPTSLFFNYCRRWGGFAGNWSNEAIWPFFAHYLDALLQQLANAFAQDRFSDRGALFRAVGSLPITPPAVVNTLFDLALGPAKGDRILAQAALANHSSKEARIVNALGSGKAEVRAIAATWLAKLRHEPAIPALEAAVAKEKNDAAKGALLDALEAFGQPVGKYLDRNALVKDAGKAPVKGLPKEIDWFAWSALPTVRWEDNREAVPADTIKWLLVQAVRQKSPEPNAMLRKYCAMFEPRDSEALGQFVLETWLREDIRPIPPDEAHRRAIAQAQTTHGWMQRAPQHFQNSPNFGKSVEQLTAAFLPAHLRQPAGSAIGSKGLLAVAAACASERAAAPVGRYLKDYYGTRAGQGKALIAMLAWINHPTATQLMLSVGARFRTKSFQQEATRQAEALAERNNWTLAELADRTIPTAGFDEAGDLDLSYGERSFTAKLLPDFKIELYNPDGKKIASLPEPRQDDDAERAKEAKKAFSSAKKDIKTILRLQTDRLYEGLCTERDWPFGDWARYLNQHPIMRRLVQRVVWVEVRDGQVVQSFRPLDDGTLTDWDDNEVTLAPEATVRIAHDTLLPTDVVAKWQQHLLDYQVTPLLQQLGKGTYVLPPAKLAETAVEDFKGFMLESFALRGRALKLGYTRGSVEDGGWFHVYEKRFPTLGLTAVIEFSGSPLPEENRNVALLRLLFVAADSAAWVRNGLPLSKVPKILLSECYNDLRLIAADGGGYDPAWEKKSSL